MCEINYFKPFVLCSCDVAADVDHLHIKIIHLEFLVSHLYIVRDNWYSQMLLDKNQINRI
jgi:hypothetical protein